METINLKFKIGALDPNALTDFLDKNKDKTGEVMGEIKRYKTKSAMLSKQTHELLSRLTAQLRSQCVGTTVSSVIDILLKAAQIRVQNFIKEMPVSAVGMTFLEIYMVAVLLDAGIIKEAELESILNQWDTFKYEIIKKFATNEDSWGTRRKNSVDVAKVDTPPEPP